MHRTATRRAALAAVLALLMALVGISAVPTPAAAQTSCQSTQVSASHPPVANFKPRLALDGKWATFFYSSHNNWQYLQVDYGCVGTFSGLRRLMSLGFGSTPNRGAQGEGVSYSVDGITWTQVLNSTSTGWENYVNYRPHAWHTVDYGWSEMLRLNTPAPARYVRFNWDGADDLLHEVEIMFAKPAQPSPLQVRLSCDVGVVTCQATASGGSGSGYGFTWTAASNAIITTQTDRGASSYIAGTCGAGQSYAVDLTVSDSNGATVRASASRRCLAAPF